MTGCGCLVLVAILIGLLYIFTFGSTDTGEPVEQAVAVAAALYALAAIGGRRSPHAVARS